MFNQNNLIFKVSESSENFPKLNNIELFDTFVYLKFSYLHIWNKGAD